MRISTKSGAANPRAASTVSTAWTSFNAPVHGALRDGERNPSSPLLRNPHRHFPLLHASNATPAAPGSSKPAFRQRLRRAACVATRADETLTIERTMMGLWTTSGDEHVDADQRSGNKLACPPHTPPQLARDFDSVPIQTSTSRRLTFIAVRPARRSSQRYFRPRSRVARWSRRR